VEEAHQRAEARLREKISGKEVASAKASLARSAIASQAPGAALSH